MATKHANISFISRLRVKGWLWTGWIMSFGGFDYFLLFVVVEGKNKLRSSLLTLVFTPLKANAQFIYGFGCTLLNPTLVILNHFLTHNSSLKTRSQICNLLL
jgi:hypothetical protein